MSEGLIVGVGYEKTYGDIFYDEIFKVVVEDLAGYCSGFGVD